MILDTNAVSALFAGDASIERLLAAAERHELPVVVIGEYRYGLARSRHRKRLATLLDELARESVVLDVDDQTAHAYALVRETMRRKGRPIPENDVWISALAIQHGLEIASLDARFDEVDGVTRRGW